MKVDTRPHQRRSVRIKEYDYSQPGAYFITLVTYRRECLFGVITNGELQLSSYGKIADEHWRAIPAHFPHARLGAHIIMPNHLHGVIEITETRNPVEPVSGITENFRRPVAG